jgi:hypothetical protein
VLEHILVIAGPSGSGKSTFMREFVENRLPSDVSAYLPVEAKTWTRTSANEITKKGLSAVLRRDRHCPGLVLHYDIMRAHTRGFENYSEDPAIQAVTGTGAALTVVTLLPRREVLFEQFLARARTEEYEEWGDRPEVRRRLKRKLRTALFKLVGKTPKLLKEGQLALLSAYATDERLKKWTDRWENFLDDVRRGRDDVRLIYAAPDPVQDDHPRFRLLRRV